MIIDRSVPSSLSIQMSRAASAHSSGNSSDEGTTSRAVAMGAADADAKGSRAPSSVGKKSKKRDKEAKKVSGRKGFSL